MCVLGQGRDNVNINVQLSFRMCDVDVLAHDLLDLNGKLKRGMHVHVWYLKSSSGVGR